MCHVSCVISCHLTFDIGSPQSILGKIREQPLRTLNDNDGSEFDNNHYDYEKIRKRINII